MKTPSLEKWIEGFLTFTFDQRPTGALSTTVLIDRVNVALPTRYGEAWDISLGKKTFLIQCVANKLRKRRVLRSFRKGRNTWYVHAALPESVEQGIKNNI